ncbi:hypothetical protein ILUMI_00528 [Ignelater luminosus]|uniref:HTH psq-type domain-containing protein n=1 Tax=Ignelater luminosus TaxID=2038154 RepID=A0A8K0DSG6_IGNLU|nr:hypothetical protein ILUMI_00528 [Ignelater luminosus]
MDDGVLNKKQKCFTLKEKYEIIKRLQSGEKQSEICREMKTVNVNLAERHNISGGQIVGEAASVNTDVVNDWLQNSWPLIRENFKDEDIFNADKTGLFYKLTPENQIIDDETEEEENEEIESDEIIPVPTTSDAIRNIEVIRYFVQSRNTPQGIFNKLAKVELHINEINFARTKQTNICKAIDDGSSTNEEAKP